MAVGSRADRSSRAHSRTFKSLTVFCGMRDLSPYNASSKEFEGKILKCFPSVIELEKKINELKKKVDPKSPNNGTGANANSVSGETGSGDAHNNMPPFYVLTYIIKY
jgi:hypothetical protein